jgi:para-nitrobenzyl esterase
MWVHPAEQMAVAQSAAGGRAWLSRWDHAPSLPPFDVLGPSHGADNACLWAHPPRFVERPLLARPGAGMTADDLAVTRVLHDAVLGMVRTGSPAGALPDWAPYEPGSWCTAVLDAGSRVESDPSAQRRAAWEAAVSRSPRAAGR